MLYVPTLSVNAISKKIVEQQQQQNCFMDYILWWRRLSQRIFSSIYIQVICATTTRVEMTTKTFNHRISVNRLKWQQIQDYCCDKHILSSLKSKIYTTLSYSSNYWTMFEKFDRDLTKAEVWQFRWSDNNKVGSHRVRLIQGTSNIKETRRRRRQNPYSIKISTVRKRGRLKQSWTNQVRPQHHRFGLTQEEREKCCEPAMPWNFEWNFHTPTVKVEVTKKSGKILHK